ncbi:hypothetical protein [Methylobacterium gnaphalii]|nr:hypothetical protein [Methylobacterium gnaphalii]GJD68719.1 hypothetical protein MMMDOFMJ_1643 [Methylobacterium gnaphalii]
MSPRIILISGLIACGLCLGAAVAVGHAHQQLLQGRLFPQIGSAAR